MARFVLNLWTYLPRLSRYYTGGGGRNPHIFSSQQTEEPFRQFAEELGALPDRARGPKHHQPCWKRLKYVTDFSILYFGMLSKLTSIDLTSDMKLLRVSRFPCCVLSYFSLVFVVKHSRRWWLHIGGSKMLAPHFKDEIAGLHKWPFLAGFDLICCSFCYCDSYLWANHV